MHKDFTLEFRGTYIYVQHSEGFEISPESLNRLYSELNNACNEYNCNIVFAEGQHPPKRRMDTLDAYASATQFVNITPGLRLAIVLPGYSADETTEFFKTASLNRGAKVDFFSDKVDAFNWLGIHPTDDVRG